MTATTQWHSRGDMQDSSEGRSVSVGAEKSSVPVDAPQLPSERSGRPSGGRHAPGRHRLRRTVVKRAFTPTTLQMEAVECGAAALSMILGYYRKFVSLEELRVRCDVSRDGSKASNVVRAAREYGLEAAGKQMGIAALAQLPPPTILFWEFNHFVVYEGAGTRFGKPVMYINDPGSGRRAVSAEDFDGSFTGVVLTFRPGASFQPGGRRPRPLRDLSNRLRHTGGALLLALLLSLLLVVVGLVAPAVTRAYVDAFLLPDDRSLVVPILAIMAGAVVLIPVLTGLQLGLVLRAQILSSTRTSAQFMRHLLRLPVGFFDHRSPADLARRLDTNDTVAETVARVGPSIIVSALVVVLYAGLLWSYDPYLAVIGLTVALLNIGLVRLVSRMRETSVAKVRIDGAKLLTISYSGIRLIETLKATGGEQDFFRRWSAQQAAMLLEQQRAQAPAALSAGLAQAIAMINSAAVLLVGGLRAIGGLITVGTLMAFQQLLRSFTDPVNALTQMGPFVQDVGADLTRIKDVEIAKPDSTFDRPETERAHRLGGRVRFANVTFGYSRLRPPLIEDLSFEVGPGQQLSLVGASGSGKSTVTRLIAGLCEPWSGGIWFDGRARTDVPRNVLAASVSFVDQDIVLFEGTVRDNVTLWDPTISDEQVVAALRDAEIYDVVAARAGGIRSRVDQEGRNFSGGQRQRLEIARALAQSPTVLVLDEATSALDAKTEQAVLENLRRRGCACIVIAHRLSTIRDSDEILVMDDGQVVQRGVHARLVNLPGPYAHLVRDS